MKNKFFRIAFTFIISLQFICVDMYISSLSEAKDKEKIKSTYHMRFSFFKRTGVNWIDASDREKKAFRDEYVKNEKKEKKSRNKRIKREKEELRERKEAIKQKKRDLKKKQKKREKAKKAKERRQRDQRKKERQKLREMKKKFRELQRKQNRN